jgi:GTPase SAR1 family protein
MPISLDTLKQSINTRQSVLLLGAGAAMPSGAPSGAALAEKLWQDVAKSSVQSDDLIDTASILERRFGRRAVMEVVRNTLQPLQPAGGLLAVPHHGWNAVFSTNFDKLVERAYKRAGVPLTPVRSNFDLTNRENREGATLYKIHGCITQDRAFGDKASMILTEQDYEDYQRYRQTMFSTLQTMMLTNDVIVLGQSLRDRHLQDLVKKVLSYRQEGVQSEIYVVVYDRDDLRAPLLEDRGAKVIFAGIDEFAHAMAHGITQESTPALPNGGTPNLAASLVSTVYDVQARKADPSNVKRMFAGGPATYADIRSGATFERSRHRDAVDRLAEGTAPLVAVIGSAGVGKTTFARQIASNLSADGIPVWEHRNDFPFQSKPWIALEGELRSSGQSGILLLDECTRYLRQANILFDALGSLEKPALRVIATANAAQWAPRLKSPIVYKKGVIIELSRLDPAEINSLINLYQYNKDVSGLVQKGFRELPRGTQVSRLREKCGADMFVCLRNIFANENLDTILLTEFEELDESYQEYYRYVAALEAVGTRVHRQLLMRMLSISADTVSHVLNGLSGIIDEYDIKPKLGIYGWSTRHIVIARRITEYKFSNYDEFEKLFDAIIDNVNPAVPMELQSVRDVCDNEFGIGRLAETKTRQRLYKRLIEAAEGERIPWHRLVRELLEHESLEDAEYGLRNAIEAVGSDGPLDRYKVRLLLARAERTPGIGNGDRLALVRRAFETAEENIRKHPADKFSYKALCDVSIELVRRGENPYIMDDPINKMREAADRILDPTMDRDLRYYEDIRAKM